MTDIKKEYDSLSDTGQLLDIQTGSGQLLDNEAGSSQLLTNQVVVEKQEEDLDSFSQEGVQLSQSNSITTDVIDSVFVPVVDLKEESAECWDKSAAAAVESGEELEDSEYSEYYQLSEDQILHMTPTRVLEELEKILIGEPSRVPSYVNTLFAVKCKVEILDNEKSLAHSFISKFSESDTELSKECLSVGKKRKKQVKKSTKRGSRKKCPVDGKRSKSNVVCPVCLTEVLSLTELKHHVGSHTELQDIQCDLCRANYPTWEDVFIHRRDHRVGKTLLCYICGKTLYDFFSLQTHHKAVHKLKYPQAYHNSSKAVTHYPCGICAEKFGNLEEIKEHLTEHKYSNESIKCEFCFTIFVEDDLLKQHMRKFHLEKTFKCDICSKSFYLNQGLAHHIRKKHDGGEIKNYNFSCPHCQLQFTVQKEFEEHVRTHSDADDVQCDLCRVNYPTWEDVFSHRRIHQVGAEVYCYICGKTPADFSSLRTHHKAVHKLKYPHTYHNTTTPIDDYACGVCELRFPLLSDLKQHLDGHKAENNPQKCESCLKCFQNLDLLEVHRRNFHLEKNFQCPMCKKAFYLSDNLEKHVKTHSYLKRFECTVCQARFKRNAGLKEHMNVHNAENVKPCVCEICGSEFKSRKFLNYHMRIHENRTRDFTCDTCGFGCFTARGLSQHKISHLEEVVVKETPYQCDVCGKKFVKKDSLTVHTRIHTGEKLLQCNICEKSFLYNSSLRQHMYTHEEHQNGFSSQKFNCNICDEEFDKRSAYLFHRMTHKEIDGFKCNVCGKKFPLRSALQKHTMAHVNEKILKCNLCQLEFESLSALKTHICSHAHAKPSFQCEVCGKYFRDRSTWKKHQFLHMGKKFSCDECNMSYCSPASLQKHKNVKHGNVTKFACQICDKVYLVKSTFNMHMRQHAGLKKYKCNICSEEFEKNSAFQYHMLSHKGIEEYKCETCGKSFYSNCRLKKHLTLHVENATLKCHICGRECADKGNLRNHVAAHFREKGKIPSKCDLCGKIFSHLSSVTTHKRTFHQIIPEFKCEICGKAFFATNTLKKHMSIHANKEPLKCSMCNKVCQDKGNLKSHMAAHLRIKKPSVKKPLKCEFCGKILSCSSHLSRHKKKLHSLESKELQGSSHSVPYILPSL